MSRPSLPATGNCRCKGNRWVCENHPEMGWPDDCDCGAGMPCPDCNPAFNIIDTAKWQFRALLPYLDGIWKQFDRLAARFPHDVTAESLWRDCSTGNKRLWMVLKGETLVGIAMTRLSTIEATGTRIAVLCDLAGDGVTQWAIPLCDALEAWAASEGAQLAAVEGRPGWGKLMKQHGYREYACLWRKELK